MTKKEMIACNSIIHTCSTMAGAVGAGLAQVPASDSAIIAPIQLSMTVSLGKVFGINLDQSIAKSTLATAASTMVGRTVSQVLVGWIPGVGNVINATTAAGLTETIGWILADEFERQSSMAKG